MELNERKVRILEYIIKDYIATAEPVGSRTIAKKYDLGLSSATIRNEMSDLEELGYIAAPHTSAGRIPSDKGYRLYVDRLMRLQARGVGNAGGLSDEEISYLRQVIAANVNQIDYLMRETAKAISLLTNYTTVVTEAVSGEERVQRLQLMELDENSVLLVTVTTSKKVRNHIIRVASAPDYDTLSALTRILNAELEDIDPAGITPALVRRLEESFRGHEQLLAQVLTSLAGMLDEDAVRQVYTSGIKNILAFPEFADLDKARGIFRMLEERDYLVMLLDGAPDGIDVVIGAENAVTELRDLSVVKTGYNLGGQSVGGIAILGPTRMDYSQAVSVLQSIVGYINNAIKSLGG